MADESGKVFFGNLAFEIDEDELVKGLNLAKYGKIVSVEIIRDRESNRSRGFGFATFESRENAEKVIEVLDGMDFGGRSITVRSGESKRGDDHSRGGGRGGMGGFSRGGGYQGRDGSYSRGGGGGGYRGGSYGYSDRY